MASGEQHGGDPADRPWPTRPRSRWRTFFNVLPDLLVVAAVVFALAAYHFELGARWGLARDPEGRPVAQRADGLSFPPVPRSVPVAAPLRAGDASPAKVRRAIEPALADPRLGSHVRVVVRDLTGSGDLYRHGTGTVTPASTMKLLTSVAALESLGPDTVFRTTVRRGGGRITLVGGGDPFLLSQKPRVTSYPVGADLGTLARRTARALRAEGVRRVHLAYDDSLFTGPSVSPAWPASYVPDGVVPPITALLADEGRNPVGSGYVADPSRSAAGVFRAALSSNRITVLGDTMHEVPPPASRRLASVASPPLGQIVSRLLLVSDNNAAEVVAHHVGAAEHDGASFAGGARAVRTVLGRLGIDLAGAQLHDGSGLSRQDRLSPDTIADVLSTAAATSSPTLRQVLTGLPVAGFTGSLTYRFDTGAPVARGRVRAKTGTLTGVHGLAGVATDRDGDVLGFVMIVDRVAKADNSYAQDRLDQIVARLAACHCARRTAASAG